MKRVKLLVILVMLVIIGYMEVSLNVYAKAKVNTDVNVQNAISLDMSAKTGVRTGYIYTGDSRTRRLNVTIGMSRMEDTWVYCKSGMGYSWFLNDSLDRINETMKQHTEIDQWVIVSAWGVNDLWNIGTYLRKYEELMNDEWRKCKLYLVSVNPVGRPLEHRYSSIESFNKKLKKYVKSNRDRTEGGVYYIDTNTRMTEDGFETFDNLHYTESTNKFLYKVIRQELDKTNTSLDNTALIMNKYAKRTIKLNGVGYNVKWSSSNEDVVKILKTNGYSNQTVQIKAKKEGTSVITAECGEYNYSCTVTVEDRKVLVAYYSYSGSVETAAEYVRDYVGGYLYEIEPYELYPVSENKFLRKTKYEIDRDKRRDLNGYVKRFSKYEKVYIGFPVWYDNLPTPVATFAEQYDWTGKTVYPFSISETGSNGNSFAKLMNLSKGATFGLGCEITCDSVDEEEGKDKLLSWMQ